MSRVLDDTYVRLCIKSYFTHTHVYVCRERTYTILFIRFMACMQRENVHNPIYQIYGMYVERERTQSFVFMYMHTQIYLETDWISGMAY